GLGRGVSCPATALAAIDGRNENHPAVPPTAREGDRRARRAEAAEDIDLETLGELRIRGLEPGTATAAGVVNEDVQAAEMVGRRLDEGFHLAQFGNIGGLRVDRRSELGGGLIEPFAVSRADRDAAAFGKQALSDGVAEAVAAPGDRGDAALEPEIQRLAALLSCGHRRGFP